MSELHTLGRVHVVADDGTELPGGSQAKRVALLAYLALARESPVRRDGLLALFWPELDEHDARAALRQALYYLRRVAGDVFNSAGDELSLRDGLLKCDAVELEQLARAGRFEEAVGLYRGEFFDSFHVDDVAPELEEWVSRTRSRLKRRASGAAWSAADAAVAAGQREHATELARRACDLDADQEAGWRRLMTMQAEAGDRIGALRTYDELVTKLERDFETKPTAETTALAARIRKAENIGGAVAANAVVDSPAPHEPRDVAPIVAPGMVPQRRGRSVTLIAGLVGAAVLAGAIGAYVKSSDDSPSLVAMGSLAAKDRIVVADFADLAGDSLLSAGITEAFRVDLSQSPIVRVLSARQVAGALERMRRPRDASLNEELARELAVREGAKAIVTGSIANVAGTFTVNVKLVSTEPGDVLAAFRESAADSSGLLAAVDRASKQLRNRIGESLRSLRALPPLSQGTTSSLAALRKYSEAQRLNFAGRRSEAIRLYEEAVSIDTAFASAYVSMASVFASIAEPGRAFAAHQRALAHRDRLPFTERMLAVAQYSSGIGDFETAIDAYSRFLERYPDDYRALNNLALIHLDRRQFAVAESVFARAAAVDSTIPNFYFGVHGAQLLQGRFRDSRATLDLITRRFPGNPILLNVEIQDAAAQQHWEEAERQAETTIAAARGDTLTLVDPYEALAGITMTQGRLAEAERHWRTQLALSAASKSHGRHLFGLIQLANLYLRHRAAPARALALVDSALAALPLDSVLRGDRLYDELARFYARAGSLTRAREMVAAAVVNDSVLARISGPDRTWTRGVLALAEGRASVAESELRQAADGLVCTICALADLARAYEATGKPAAAVTVYERYLTTPWLWRYEVDAHQLGWAMKRLAELYDSRGETAKAAEVRGRLLQLWRRADPELQPVLAEARARLTR